MDGGAETDTDREGQNAVAVAVLKGSQLRIFQLRADGSVRSTFVPFAIGVRLRAPVQGPDGDLFVTTDNRPGGDVILRLTPN